MRVRLLEITMSLNVTAPVFVPGGVVNEATTTAAAPADTVNATNIDTGRSQEGSRTRELYSGQRKTKQCKKDPRQRDRQKQHPPRRPSRKKNNDSTPLNGPDAAQQQKRSSRQQPKRKDRRRKQPNGCKQTEEILSEGVNMSANPMQDPVVVEPFLFPALIPSLFERDVDVDADSQAGGATGVWSRTESLRSSLYEHENETTGNETGLSGDSLFENLTMLGSRPPKQQQPSISLTSLPCATSLQPIITRRLDISRLRNRWWDALQSRPIPTRGIPVETESLNHKDDSSDESFVGTPNVQLVPKPKKESVHLEPSYTYCDQPLHEAVRRDDDRALKALLVLQTPKSLASDSTEMSPLQLAVNLDRPRLVRILLAASAGSVDNTNNNYPAPILMAAENGREECLQSLLLAGSSTVLSRDVQGNNVLHCACRGEASESTLRLILSVVGNSTVSKLLSGKNQAGQTPLHCICEYGRVDLLEVVLSTRLSLLARILATQDVKRQTPLLSAIAAGSTDVVMSILMWRGNNHVSTGSARVSSPCPLVWAVRSRNVEMVLLLLEFNDPSGAGYNLTNALHVVVESIDDKSRVELARVLIGAGANPYSTDVPSAQSAIRLAVERRDSETLAALLDSYDYYLETVRESRRRDPVLQKQPESFFAGMESRENAERVAATRDALVVCLFVGWQSKEHSSSYHACSLVLFRRQVNLGQAGSGRLHMSLVSNELTSMADVPSSRSYTYQTQYSHSVGRFTKLKERDGALRHWSTIMCSMPWMRSKQDVFCTWTRSEQFGDFKLEVPEPDVVLVADDQTRYLAHGAILSTKSAKLEAALRFASMNKSDDSGLPEIQVCASGQVCIWLLQHIYHGSICSGLAREPEEYCQALLEVLLLAEEFICRSLVQECEMRLLANETHQCFCCSCARAGSIENQRVDCNYIVDGPSWCVTSGSALDVLAVAQHVNESCVEADYHLCVTKKQGFFSSSTEEVGACILQPMDALREMAICTILQDFTAILDSGTVDSPSGDGDVTAENCHENRHEWLLEMCLQELSTLPGAVKPSQSRRLHWSKLATLTNK